MGTEGPVGEDLNKFNDLWRSKAPPSAPQVAELRLRVSGACPGKSAMRHKQPSRPLPLNLKSGHPPALARMSVDGASASDAHLR